MPSQMIASGISARVGTARLICTSAVDQRVADAASGRRRAPARAPPPTPIARPTAARLERREQVGLQPPVGDQLAHRLRDGDRRGELVRIDPAELGDGEPERHQQHRADQPLRRQRRLGVSRRARRRARVVPGSRSSASRGVTCSSVVDMAARRRRAPTAHRRAGSRDAAGRGARAASCPSYSVRNRPRRCSSGTTPSTNARSADGSDGGHQVEAVGRAGAEPLLDRVRDLLRRAGDDAVAAAAAEAAQQPPQRDRRSRSTIRCTSSKRLV